MLARAWFGLQAVAVNGWWILLVRSAGARELFALHDAPPAALTAFAAGDLVVVAPLSLLLALRPRARWSGPAAWAVAGAMGYAALYTVATAALGASGWLGAGLMLPAAVGSVLAASQLTRPPAEPVGSERPR